MFKPKVSIIIPVYNGSNYLKEAIDSALAQTYENIEVIVVNDGSNDNGATEKIALSYGDSIRYFKKENGGSSSALNCGIRHMQGDYFSWLSHDDLYLKDKIEKQIALLEKRKDKVVICGAELIDSKGKIIPYAKRDLNGHFDNIEMLKRLSKGYGINGCGVLISKTIMDRVGTFNENLVYLNDMDYWYRMVIDGCDFVCTSEKLVKSRVHDGQMTVKRADAFKSEFLSMSEKIIYSLFSLSANNRDSIEMICIYLYCVARLGEIELVRKTLSELKLKGYNINIINYLIVYFYGKCINIGKIIYKGIFFKR